MTSKISKKVSKSSDNLAIRESESVAACDGVDSSNERSSSQESDGVRRSARSNAGVPPLDSAAYVFDLAMLRSAPSATSSLLPVSSSPANPIVLDSSESESDLHPRRKLAKKADPIESFSDDEDGNTFLRSLKGPFGSPKLATPRSKQPSKHTSSEFSVQKPVSSASSTQNPDTALSTAPVEGGSGNAAVFPQRQSVSFASTNAKSAPAPPHTASDAQSGSAVRLTPSVPVTSRSAAKPTPSALAASVPPALLLSPSAATRVVSHTPLPEAQAEVPKTPVPAAQPGHETPPPPLTLPLFPIPARGYIPPINPPPVPPSVMPSPTSPMTNTVYWNPHHRLELLSSLRYFCTQDPHNTVRFILEADDFTATTFRGFIDYLASRVRHAEFFRMALSAISEAFRGSPSRYTTETVDTLRANILISVGSAKNLEELVRSRPISSFTPMFLALFSPQCYPDLLKSCGFGDPESLTLPRPPGPPTSAPALHAYMSMSQLIRPRQLMSVIFALSAHILSVCSSPLTIHAAGVLATRV